MACSDETLMACSAAYLAAGSACSTREGLRGLGEHEVDFGEDLNGDRDLSRGVGEVGLR